jgi:PAS domain-containing protein
MSTSDPPERNDPERLDELRCQAAALESEVARQERLEEALSGREAQYRTLFELMPGSVVLLDPEGFVRDANPFFCQNMGYTHEDLLGMHVTEFSQERPEVI